MQLNHGTPVAPRDASTLLLLRGPDPWRLLMMRRPRGADFLPDVWVYPGGGVLPEDRTTSDPMRATAVRETFEEVGLLLARDRSGRAARATDCDRLRAALQGGGEFWAALSGLGLEPDFDGLGFLARWITPEVSARRFDTRFYVARHPAAQEVVAQAGEVSETAWVSPWEALSADGPSLTPPTRRIMESVAHEPSATRLLARLRRRRQDPRPILPVVRQGADGSLTVVDDAPVFRGFPTPA